MIGTEAFEDIEEEEEQLDETVTTEGETPDKIQSLLL